MGVLEITPCILGSTFNMEVILWRNVPVQFPLPCHVFTLPIHNQRYIGFYKSLDLHARLFAIQCEVPAKSLRLISHPLLHSPSFWHPGSQNFISLAWSLLTFDLINCAPLLSVRLSRTLSFYGYWTPLHVKLQTRPTNYEDQRPAKLETFGLPHESTKIGGRIV
uniref:Uncharacterized protein n=1 Tax=Schistocephalus solidus TaxID=70667 RepID=A0A0V0J7W5_SCHSO